MKVSGNPPPQTRPIESQLEGHATHRAKGSAQKPATDGQTASVDISDDAKLMKKTADLVHEAPDIRKEKVEALKKAIASGNYQVDAEAVADRILQDHLTNDFGKNNL